MRAWFWGTVEGRTREDALERLREAEAQGATLADMTSEHPSDGPERWIVTVKFTGPVGVKNMKQPKGDFVQNLNPGPPGKSR